MRDSREGQTPDGHYWLSQRPGSANWYRTWFDNGSRQTLRASLKTASKEQAHERLVEWWVANRSLKLESPSSITLLDVLHRYYNEYAINLASEEFVRVVFSKVRSIAGAVSVAEFDKNAQKEFVLAMPKASDGYKRRIFSSIKAGLNWAVENELISSAPVIKLPDDGAARDRVLTFKESNAIWFATETLHERMFVALAFGTLSRPEAILDVTKGMADLDTGLLALNPPGRKQTKKFRPTVPIVDELKPWIENAQEGHLVQWRHQPIASFKTAWRSIRSRAGLGPDVFAKTIRTTMATQMRKEGVPEADIQGYLGHKAYQGKTEVYAKYRPEYLSRGASVVNNYLAMIRNCYAPSAEAPILALSEDSRENHK